MRSVDEPFAPMPRNEAADARRLKACAGYVPAGSAPAGSIVVGPDGRLGTALPTYGAAAPKKVP